jgi:hypothetical protein
MACIRIIVTKSKKNETANPRECAKSSLPAIPKKVPACRTETPIKTRLTSQKKPVLVKTFARHIVSVCPITTLFMMRTIKSEAQTKTATILEVTMG